MEGNISKYVVRVRPDKEKKIEELSNLDKEEVETLEKNIENNIEHIVLTGNSYSKKFCEQIGELFKKSTKLTRVDVHDTFVSRLKTELPEAIGFLGNGLIGKNIIELDISDNAVNPFGAIALSPFLEQATSLKVFLINNAGLGIDGVKTISAALAKGTPNLEKFAITRNRAENPGAIAIAEALPKLTKLKELIVFQDVIKKDGMLALLKSLATNCPDLELLDIRDNFLKEETIQEMANLIKVCKKLRALNISDCNIEEDENDIIIQALEESEVKLEKLGYNYAELNSNQAKKLIDILFSRNSELKRLDIKGNDFNSATQKYYKEKFGDKSGLSNFESDDEEEEDPAAQLVKDFANLHI
ncbi:Ran GTPase-activating protein (macronuclear) [Tetrahymena thermophila SB210]|uniref:Ran GTPase-activating protein n=1 Tax=Tetrahymena thermophila (strain SB210) TaxID=312017 RepID=I7M486_TETTS|nr:Ran GTPase-activating protein [Tetrahymena thermophila SB210]EAS05158.1 Ran GTPase-activating protein [Tetrahymena thermophila SB210]|eukprot:XP_001025403.1 Ran GTPase-activating protein [Tetrahymena thermophila SB210]